MQTIFSSLRALALGVLNGALYSAVQFLLVFAYFDYRIQRRAEVAQEFDIQMQSINLFNARIVSLWFIVFFTVASVLGHRYLLRLKKQAVLFWEAIGLAAIIGWNVVVLTVFWISAQLTGQTSSLELVTAPGNPLFGPISIGVVIITNFIYGTVVALMEKRRQDHEPDRRPA
jgi:hypothetical protein